MKLATLKQTDDGRWAVCDVNAGAKSVSFLHKDGALLCFKQEWEPNGYVLVCDDEDHE